MFIQLLDAQIDRPSRRDGSSRHDALAPKTFRFVHKTFLKVSKTFSSDPSDFSVSPADFPRRPFVRGDCGEGACPFVDSGLPDRSAGPARSVRRAGSRRPSGRPDRSVGQARLVVQAGPSAEQPGGTETILLGWSCALWTLYCPCVSQPPSARKRTLWRMWWGLCER